MHHPSPLLSHSTEESFAWAREFASHLKAGDVIGLKGTLGAGKTLLCKGICSGLGFSDEVTSPTYSIVQEYMGKNKIIHLDFYRTKSQDEFLEIGLDYYLDGHNICLIEWPEKNHGYPIDFTHMISIHQKTGDTREISVEQLRE